MATVARTNYVDFEPYCEWKKDDGAETLIVHLPDFKRNQVRVQVNTQGVLKVSGEKPENEAQSKRFYKETKIPEGCDINDIRAKFSNGCLHITMPKKPQISAEASGPLETKKTAKAEASDPKDEEPNRAPSGNENYQGVVGDGMSIVKLLEGKKNKVAVGVGIGIAVVAVVAIGAYIALKWGGSGSDSGASSSSSSHVEEARHS